MSGKATRRKNGQSEQELKVFFPVSVSVGLIFSSAAIFMKHFYDCSICGERCMQYPFIGWHLYSTVITVICFNG